MDDLHIFLAHAIQLEREAARHYEELTEQMHQAAADLHFELAARLRDELSDLKKELRQMTAATS